MHNLSFGVSFKHYRIMSKNKQIAIFILFFPSIMFSQTRKDTIILKKELAEVQILSNKARENTPISFKNINKREITENNLGQDLPYIINLSPSITTSSDAGAGIGYTNFRLRGSDATRINVTVNGVPLNDSESQGVWWVNMPDFASSLENIQIQRGVGTSTNGAAAFGGSINLETNKMSKDNFFKTSNTIGSYRTIKNTLEFGTGLISDKIIFQGRLSNINSDGYIDRASSDLKSMYLEGGVFNKNSILKALLFTGHEKTYQAWNGVPLNYLDSNRTYNSYTYENEIDNYQQTHFHLNYIKNLKNKLSYSVTAHYTNGKGYYEQERLDEPLSDYGLENIFFENDTISNTDLIRRKWLNNDFGGFIYSINKIYEKYDVTLGGGNNRYSGQHYGNIIWSQYASNAEYNHQYYWNKAMKLDNNIYLKINYEYENKFNFYVDLQSRNIEYTFEGKDNDGNSAEQKINLTFFNPKLGIYHKINQTQQVYASYAIANKEPNRNDYVESTPNSRPLHETLYNAEIGFKKNKNKYNLGVNFYHMLYDNQLVLTGKINDVGAYTRTNIDKSYRQGLEIEGEYRFSDQFNWNGNMTLSQNKINKFDSYIDNWDTGTQEIIEYSNTDLSFSPNILWTSLIKYKIGDISVNFISKYVGEQFIDNTSSLDRMLDDYLVNNLRISYSWKNKIFKRTNIALQINNILNNEYVSNAWVYQFITTPSPPENPDPTTYDMYVNKDSVKGYNMAGYFPEATRNYLVKIDLDF